MRRILSVLAGVVTIIVGATAGISTAVTLKLMAEPRDLEYGEFLVSRSHETAERRILRLLIEQYDNTRMYHSRRLEKSRPPELPVLCGRRTRGCA